MMIEVVNKSVIAIEDEEHKEGLQGDFSNLPKLVLWMIKDRLDFANNSRFASVCKSWREATLSYSKDARSCWESPPWLMIKDLECPGRCEFISTTTGERFNIFHRDLYPTEATKTFFTKQGWLLLGTKMRKSYKYIISGSCLRTNNNDTGLGLGLLLLNPFTKNKIKLPDGVSWIPNNCGGAFTLVNGKPDLVVFACLQNGCKKGPIIRMWTIRVTDGNSLWTKHTFKVPPRWDSFCLRGVVIIGHNIYIVYRTSEFLVFDLSSNEWSITERDWRNYCIRSIDAKKGLIWRIDTTDRATAMLRLNDNCRDWEKLEVEELVNKCWFINFFDDYFVAKDMDDAIYKDLAGSGLRRVEKYRHYHKDPPINMYFKEWTIVEWVDMP